MQLLRSAILWVWLVAAGPNCFHSLTAGYQVQVRIPVWDVGGLITRVTGHLTGQDSGQPPKKKERPHHEEYWPPYGYYDPALMYPPYYYPYPPYPPPTNPPWPTKGPTKKPTPPTTKKPPETTTKQPTETTTKQPTETTTKPPTVTTTGTPITTTVAPTDTTTEASGTDTTEATTEGTTEGTTEATTTNPNGRDLCRIYPLLPECQAIKSVHRKKNKPSSSVLQPDQKLSVETKPHSVTSLCFYYPRLCMKPEEAQFVSLSDENGRPLLLISPVDKKSVNSRQG